MCGACRGKPFIAHPQLSTGAHIKLRARLEPAPDPCVLHLFSRSAPMERIVPQRLSGTHGEAETIAATYLRPAHGDARVAVDVAIADALIDIDAVQRETERIARSVSRG